MKRKRQSLRHITEALSFLFFYLHILHAFPKISRVTMRKLAPLVLFLLFFPAIASADFNAFADSKVTGCACGVGEGRIYITNTGYSEHLYTITVSGSASGFATVSPASLYIAPGKQGIVSEFFNLPCGSARDYSFDVAIKATDGSERAFTQVISSQKCSNLASKLPDTNYSAGNQERSRELESYLKTSLLFFPLVIGIVIILIVLWRLGKRKQKARKERHYQWEKSFQRAEAEKRNWHLTLLIIAAVVVLAVLLAFASTKIIAKIKSNESVQANFSKAVVKAPPSKAINFSMDFTWLKNLNPFRKNQTSESIMPDNSSNSTSSMVSGARAFAKKYYLAFIAGIILLAVIIVVLELLIRRKEVRKK